VHGLVSRELAALLLSEYEAFGISALEAMASSVSVIAAKRASVPEVGGDTGLLVEPTLAARTADTILDLMADLDYRDKLVSPWRERAQQLPWQASADRLANALEEFGPRSEGT